MELRQLTPEKLVELVQQEWYRRNRLTSNRMLEIQLKQKKLRDRQTKCMSKKRYTRKADEEFWNVVAEMQALDQEYDHEAHRLNGCCAWLKGLEY